MRCGVTSTFGISGTFTSYFGIPRKAMKDAKPTANTATIKTIIPYPWQFDKSVQGWKKMFYLNPVLYLNNYFKNNKS